MPTNAPEAATRAHRDEQLFRLAYTVSRDLACTPEAAWAVLTDASGYARWNRAVSSLDGTIAVGERLKLTVPIAPGRTFTPRVVAMEAPARMVWQDGFFPMFQGTRTFTLERTASGSRFEMCEVFRGVMLPMIKGSLPDMSEAFALFADDLAIACSAS